MQATDNLPVRVISTHQAHAIDEGGRVICVCGDFHPCESWRGAAKGQLQTAAKIVSAVTTEYLKLVTLPRLAGMAEELRHRLFDWIPDAMESQRLAERAWAATSTAAQRAVNSIPTWHRKAATTHRNQRPVRHRSM